ncbi:MAG TPA: hypothetical protein VKA09_00960 [Nitrososphaeraceae archaeon]|nr:hypothetical protein [Nitrososphaeraceae archaeon]
MSQTYLTTITSIMPIAMLIIGMGIVMVPPMILEALYSYSPDNETVIEEATNSPLMMSYFSFCTSYSRFNWTRYKGNSSQNPYWKRSKHQQPFRYHVDMVR